MNKLLFSVLFSIGLLNAQSDEVVTVPKKYVSSEGLNHVKEKENVEPPEVLNKWIGIGKEVGIATKEGLNSVVDVSEKFGTTNVGHFVMFMIAWRFFGSEIFHNIFHIFIGIPLLVGGCLIWYWSLRRFFFSRRVLIKQDKNAKTKEWSISPKYDFESNDTRTCCAVIHVILICAWVFPMVYGIILN